MADSATLPAYETDLAIPPGDFLKEELDARGMTQAELALRMGRPAQAINEILNGRKAITAETALELESVLGISATLWTNLENTYRLALARHSEREDIESEIELANMFPAAWLAKSGALPRGLRGVDLVRALRSFFGVASLHQAIEVAALPRFRATGSPAHQRAGSLAAWLRLGELAFDREPPAGSYDDQAFREAVQATSSLLATPARESLPSVVSGWSQAGVALVLSPEPPNVGVNGCTRWMSASECLVQVNLRWRWADVFWFTLFHEAHHVMKHRLRKTYSNVIDADDEDEADAFARDLLIPPQHWDSFLQLARIGKREVEAFAAQVAVPPGIVVGRLQHEGIIPHSHLNQLRERWRWPAA